MLLGIKDDRILRSGDSQRDPKKPSLPLPTTAVLGNIRANFSHESIHVVVSGGGDIDEASPSLKYLLVG